MRLGLIALLLIGCSSSSKSGPTLADDDRAGVVVSVTGAVTATLKGEQRTLAVEAPVFAGDTIETPAEGAVAIELAHNGAVLSLGGDKQVVLRQHAAWRAKPAKGGALDRESDDQTAVAGRHAERSGADDRSTARRPLAMEGDDEPAPDRATAAETVEKKDPGPGAVDKDPAPAAERERLAKERARLEAQRAELERERARLEAELAEREKQRASEVERKLAEEKLRRLKEEEARRKRDKKGGGGKDKIKVNCDPNDPLCGLDDGGGAAPDRLARALDGVDTTSCKPHGTGVVELKVTLAADGKLTVTVVKAPSEALGNCVAGLVRALKLGAGDARTATRTFEVR